MNRTLEKIRMTEAQQGDGDADMCLLVIPNCPKCGKPVVERTFNDDKIMLRFGYCPRCVSLGDDIVGLVMCIYGGSNG